MIWDNTNRCIEGISLVWRSFGDESIAGGAIGMDEPKKLYQPFWCELEGTKILVSGKLRGYYPWGSMRINRVKSEMHANNEVISDDRK